jgi:hypothetical protein
MREQTVRCPIEERFAGEPVLVIGVHSAKFISEKDPWSIRRAIAPHGGGRIFIADSNNHRVLRGDARTGEQSPLPIGG